MRKENLRSKKGITLIALVVTIIVLLILAGISIAMLTGENGIIKQAVNAKNNTEIAEEKEKVEMAAQAARVKSLGGVISHNNLEEELDKAIGRGKYTLSPNGDAEKYTVIYKESERSYKVENNGTVGKIKQIPASAMPANAVISKIPGEYEDIDNGIVIYIIPNGVDTKREGFWTEDKKKFNSSGELVTVGEGEESDGILDVQQEYDQFVWVPVENAVLDLTDNPATEDVETNYFSTLNDTQIKSAVANAKDKDGKQIYPMAIKTDATNYIGVLYKFNDSTTENKVEIKPDTLWTPKSTTGSREPDTVTTYDGEVDADGNPRYLPQINEILEYASNNANYISSEDDFKERLQKEYNEMVNSVKANGGFWIGRYETSHMKINPTVNDNVSVIKGTTEGITDTTYHYDGTGLCWYKMYAEQSLYSSRANLNKTISSMIWGSQWDQVMIWMKDVPSIYTDTEKYTNKHYITNGVGMGNYGVEVTETDGTKTVTTKSSKGKEPTGNSENYKVKNIYDMAGNIFDCTLESYSTDVYTLRGGICINTNSFDTRAFYRNTGHPIISDTVYGSRLSLYVK